MKIFDKTNLIYKEIKQDKEDVIITIFVKMLLFSIILILIVITADLDSMFDRYLKESMPEVYYATMDNVEEKDIKELQKAGFYNIYIYCENISEAKLIYNNKVQKDISIDILSGEEELNQYEVVEGDKSYQSNNQECDLWVSYHLLKSNNFHVGEKLQLKDKDGKEIRGIIKGTLKKCDEDTIYISFFSLSNNEEIGMRNYPYTMSADMKSIKNYDILKYKMRFKGKILKAGDLEEYFSFIFIAKGIFIGLSIIGLFLLISAINSLYSIRLEKRKKYIQMLYVVGLPKKTIKEIYNGIYIMCTLAAIIMAMVIAHGVIDYINFFLESRIRGMYISEKKLIYLAGMISIINMVLMKRSFSKRSGNS